MTQNWTNEQKVRFMHNVDKDGPIHRVHGQCWAWVGPYMKGNRYGYFYVNYKARRSHRCSWEIHCGIIPKGLHVLHICDNRGCVNPLHLFLGTQKDNEADKVAKDRQAKGETCGKSVITEEIALNIRAEYQRGSRLKGQSALARKYGLDQTTISQIVRRKTWKHI